MDRLFLYLGICIWIWASKHSATWHTSGNILMRCVSRQEAGDIMMVHVLSVACRQFMLNETHALFLCPCMQMCSLRLQFADFFYDSPLVHKIPVNQTGPFYLSQACSEDAFNSFQKQTNDSHRFISEPISVWLVFTNNLSSQTTWLEVKLKLVNFLSGPFSLIDARSF